MSDKRKRIEFRCPAHECEFVTPRWRNFGRHVTKNLSHRSSGHTHILNFILAQKTVYAFAKNCMGVMAPATEQDVAGYAASDVRSPPPHPLWPAAHLLVHMPYFSVLLVRLGIRSHLCLTQVGGSVRVARPVQDTVRMERCFKKVRPCPHHA